MMDLSGKAVAVARYFPLGSHYLIALDKVLAYQVIEWCPYSLSPYGNTLVPERETKGKALKIWMTSSSGLVRDKVIVAPEDDEEMMKFLDEVVNVLDNLFLEAGETALYMPARKGEAERIKTNDFIRIGNLRTRLKDITNLYLIDSVHVESEEFKDIVLNSLVVDESDFLLFDHKDNAVVSFIQVEYDQFIPKVNTTYVDENMVIKSTSIEPFVIEVPFFDTTTAVEVFDRVKALFLDQVDEMLEKEKPKKKRGRKKKSEEQQS